MKRYFLPYAGIVMMAMLLSACGGSDEKESAESGNGGGEGGSNAPAPRTAEEKLVGKWQAIISFDNDKFDAARDALASDAEREALDALVEQLMGSTMDLVFTEDKQASSTRPGDSSRIANGTWEIADDQNDSATVTMKLVTRGGEQTIELDVAFQDEDNFTAPFDPAPQAQGFFYLEVVRVGDGA